MYLAVDELRGVGWHQGVSGEAVATKRGRPTKKTKDTIARIVQAIEMGATRRLASLYAGIDDSTLYDWQARFPDFSEQVKRAEAKAAIRWLARIEDAANQGSWQAAAWKLERLYKAEYGRHMTAQHSGPDGEAMKVEHTGSIASLDAVLSKLSPEIVAQLASIAEEMDANEMDG